MRLEAKAPRWLPRWAVSARRPAGSDDAGLKALRLRCEERLRALGLPARFGLAVVCETLQLREGRPILLLPTSDLPGLHGCLLSTDTEHVIVYESRTSPLHQAHIVAHELSNLVCEHTDEASASHETI